MHVTVKKQKAEATLTHKLDSISLKIANGNINEGTTGLLQFPKFLCFNSVIPVYH